MVYPDQLHYYRTSYSFNTIDEIQRITAYCSTSHRDCEADPAPLFSTLSHKMEDEQIISTQRYTASLRNTTNEEQQREILRHILEYSKR